VVFNHGYLNLTTSLADLADKGISIFLNGQSNEMRLRSATSLGALCEKNLCDLSVNIFGHLPLYTDIFLQNLLSLISLISQIHARVARMKISAPADSRM
jgi:hypothetical protein